MPPLVPIDRAGQSAEHLGMCNMYRMSSAPAEIARLFGARSGAGANFAAEVYPGYPGLVVAEGEPKRAIGVVHLHDLWRTEMV